MKWIWFGLFVLVSWTLMGFLLLTMGWAPCQEVGSCAREGIVAVVTVLLLPIQAGLAAYLRQRDL